MANQLDAIFNQLFQYALQQKIREESWARQDKIRAENQARQEQYRNKITATNYALKNLHQAMEGFAQDQFSQKELNSVINDFESSVLPLYNNESKAVLENMLQNYKAKAVKINQINERTKKFLNKLSKIEHRARQSNNLNNFDNLHTDIHQAIKILNENKALQTSTLYNRLKDASDYIIEKEGAFRNFKKLEDSIKEGGINFNDKDTTMVEQFMKKEYNDVLLAMNQEDWTESRDEIRDAMRKLFEGKKVNQFDYGDTEVGLESKYNTLRNIFHGTDNEDYKFNLQSSIYKNLDKNTAERLEQYASKYNNITRFNVYDYIQGDNDIDISKLKLEPISNLVKRFNKYLVNPANIIDKARNKEEAVKIYNEAMHGYAEFFKQTVRDIFKEDKKAIREFVESDNDSMNLVNKDRLLKLVYPDKSAAPNKIQEFWANVIEESPEVKDARKTEETYKTGNIKEGQDFEDLLEMTSVVKNWISEQYTKDIKDERSKLLAKKMFSRVYNDVIQAGYGLHNADEYILGGHVDLPFNDLKLKKATEEPVNIKESDTNQTIPDATPYSHLRSQGYETEAEKKLKAFMKDFGEKFAAALVPNSSAAEHITYRVPSYSENLKKESEEVLDLLIEQSPPVNPPYLQTSQPVPNILQLLENLKYETK